MEKVKNWRRTIMIDDGYVLLTLRILCPDTRLIVKNGRGGITFKDKSLKREVEKCKKN